MYASLLCHECLGVALLHCHSWSATEPWLLNPAAEDDGHHPGVSAGGGGGGSVEMVSMANGDKNGAGKADALL